MRLPALDAHAWRDRADALRADPARLVLWAAIAAYSVALSWLAVLRYRFFWSGRFDLGNMVQAVWSTTQGRPLESTDTAGTQFVRLGAHVDPILVLLAPLWLLVPRPEMLLVVQVLAVASGAIPVFLLGRRWLASDALAVAGAVVYLLYPPQLWSVLTEFHAVVFATPLLAWAIWAVEEGRPGVLFTTAGLALICKEHVGLAIALLGLYAAVAHGRRAWGVVLAVTGVAWTAVCMTVIIPHFAPSGGNPFSNRYDHLGGSLTSLPRTLVTDPLRVLETVTTEPKLLYLLAIFLPLMFLPAAAPLLALPALPELAMNLLTDYWPQFSVQFQYTAVATPFLIAATLRGLARVRALPGLPVPLRPAGLWAAALLVAVLAGGWRQGPLPVWFHVPGGSQERRWEYSGSPHVDAMAAGVAVIDDGAAVSAGNPFGARLSNRRHIYSFPVVKDAQWVIVDQKRPYVRDQLVSEWAFIPYMAGLRADPAFRQVFSRDGVVVFRRVSRQDAP